MKPLFLVGTLRHAPLLAVVSGAEALPVTPATLDAHGALQAIGPDGTVQRFPLIAPRAGAQVDGLLIHPDPVIRARLERYLHATGNDACPVTVQTVEGPVAAEVYLPQERRWREGADWSLAEWVRVHGPLIVETAAEVMALLPHTPPDAVKTRYAMLQMRVASRARARADTAPATLRRSPQPGDVVVEDQATPYVRYFGVEEADLRFRRFNGMMSAPVKRAAFVMSDAVTVLPYDPVRDSVLVIEQFRFGPLVRGDLNPWSLEPIAGRIDPGETPEQALRRETREEAGLELAELLPIGGHYPSPGAVSEYLYSYIGLARLTAEDEGVSGLESEAEDIRAQVIPFERLMALVDSGEVQNGPLLLSAHWLARHRDRLRKA